VVLSSGGYLNIAIRDKNRGFSRLGITNKKLILWQIMPLSSGVTIMNHPELTPKSYAFSRCSSKSLYYPSRWGKKYKYE
jgi:hypothetical protein